MPTLQVVAAAATADERISWQARGDISGGVHQGSELGRRRQLRPHGDIRLASLLTQLLCYVCFFAQLQISQRRKKIGA